jgi:phosphatidylglycerophosphatase C
MRTRVDARTGGRSVRTVAAFDFDGTLSSRDNVLPYLRIVAGGVRLAQALAAAAPSLLATHRDPTRRDVAKAEVLRRTLRARREDHLRDLGRRFARLVVTRHMHPEVVARLRAHQEAGHDVALVSASLRLYLDPVAELLGIPTVLATEMEVGPDGRLTGEIAGANVRGPEKVRRLDAWLGDADAIVFAYGDSRGDTELLARADHPIQVDRRGRIPAGAPMPTARAWTAPSAATAHTRQGTSTTLR